MTELHKQIRTIRLLRELNQDQLSLATGIDRTLISRIESGYVEPTPDQLARIKTALNWPSDEAMDAAFRLLAGEPCGVSHD